MHRLFEVKSRDRLKLAVAAAVVFGCMAYPMIFAEAKQKYMSLFDNDPITKPEYHNNCGVCHVSKQGGGERTYFGDDFEANGYALTQELREKYPKFFK